MFTNNYIEYQKALFKSGDPQEIGTLTDWLNRTGTHYMSAKMGLGGWMKIANCRTQITGNVRYYTSTYAGVYFGTNPTPATRDDYNLKSIITSGLAITNPTALRESTDGNGKYTISADFIVNNVSGNEININEVGLFVPFNDGYRGDVALALMERTVMDEPISIPPGEFKVVTYSITFNQPAV